MKIRLGDDARFEVFILRHHDSLYPGIIKSIKIEQDISFSRSRNRFKLHAA